MKMNVFIGKGNLTRDPEVRAVKDTHVVNFTIAVSEFYKKDGETVKDTEFFDCEAWDNNAVTIGKILQKGDPVLVQGKLRTDKWETEDGQKRSKIKVRVNTFDKLARFAKQEDNSGPVADESEQSSGELVGAVADGDDIPF
jgi:single-strand DNA-binding protein